MTGEIPTKFGDVLILTRPSSSLHFVCPVAADGQQGITADHHTITARDEAVATAQSLVVPEGRVFLRDLDSGEWDQISN